MKKIKFEQTFQKPKNLATGPPPLKILNLRQAKCRICLFKMISDEMIFGSGTAIVVGEIYNRHNQYFGCFDF
jgi:hypothetical protein